MPLQVYCAGLFFAPERSIIRQQFIEELHWMYQLPMTNKNWSVELQTLESLSAVTSVAFSPDGQLLASCTGNVIQLWDSATGAMRHALEGHSGPVTLLTFSPKGSLLASGSNDGTVRLWNSATGTIQQTLESHSGAIKSVVFSPDGKLLASGAGSLDLEEGEEGDSTVQLWNTATGTLQYELGGHSGAINSVVFSPGGTLLASGIGDSLFAKTDTVVRIWNTATGTLHQTLEDHSDTISPVAFSPDGETIAFGTRNFFEGGGYHRTVRLWDVSTGTLQYELEGHSDAINSVVFSPDGRLLASGSEDMTLRLWDSVTGTLRHTLKGHSAGITSLIFSPDGRLVVSSCDLQDFTMVKDHNIRLWDPVTGALLQILRGHSAGVHSVAFSPDSRLLASGSEDMTVRLWDPTVNQQNQTLTGHQKEVNSLAFSPDGNILASRSSDKTLRLWDAAKGTPKQVLEGPAEASIAFSPDSRLLASTCFGANDTTTVRLWESTTGVLQKIQVVTGSLHWVEEAFALDGSLLALIFTGNTLLLLDPIADVVKQRLERQPFRSDSIVFSPDMTLLASPIHDVFFDNTILLWDLVTGHTRLTLKPHSSRISCIALSPNGRLIVSCHDDKIMRVWDLATGALLHWQTLEDRFSAVFSLAFSPDGQVLAFSSWDRRVRIWNLATGALHQTIAFCGIPGNIRFSQDGSYITTTVGVFHSQPQYAQMGFELYIDSEYWICINRERVLWLPVEFRPTCSVVFDGKIALGHHSGRVSIMGFRAL